MKYLCFGYLDTTLWASKSDSEQKAMIDACFTYDDELRKTGAWVWGEAIQGPENATTLQYRNGKVAVTDGPFAESKELLGGLLILEARDLNHAIQLISTHPGVKMGTWEIRPANDITPMIKESEGRRRAIPK